MIRIPLPRPTSPLLGEDEGRLELAADTIDLLSTKLLGSLNRLPPDSPDARYLRQTVHLARQVRDRLLNQVAGSLPAA